MASKEAKAIERAFREQAEAVPLRPLDEGALAREVELHKQRREAAEARRRAAAEDLRQVAGKADAVSVADGMPEVAKRLEALALLAKGRTAEEVRADVLKREILPRLEQWNFGPRFQREITDWGCEEQMATYEVCRRKLRGVGAVVALIGVRGAGKTTIAAQLAVDRAWQERATREAGKPGFIATFAYRKVTTLVRRFKPLYANFGSVDVETLTLALDRLCGRETDVLVIDELHDLSELAVREALLLDVIDRRYAAQVDTLLISNQTPAEWVEQTPLSIQSRIHEHGCVLPCEWQSWRNRG